MITKNLLRKGAMAYGNTKEEFEKDMKKFRPIIKQVKTDEITILHFGEADRNGYYSVRKLNIENVCVDSFEPELGEVIKVDRNILNKRYKLNDDLIDEIYGCNGDQEIGYAIMVEGSLYIPTRDFMATFCNSLGAGFNKLPTGRDLMRDLYIISHLFDAKEKLSFVCKHDPDCKYSVYRVFAAFSDSFKLHDNSNILFLVDNIINRGYEISKYTMNHSVSEIDFYDPNGGVTFGGKTVYSGIRLSWSDVGDASFSLNSTMIVDGSVTLTNIKRTLGHKTSFDKNAYKNLLSEFFPLLMKETTLFKLEELPDEKKLSTKQYRTLLLDAGINKKAVKDSELADVSVKEFILMILTKSAEIGENPYDRTSKVLQLENRVNQVIWTIMG